MKPFFLVTLAAAILSQTAKADYADLVRAEQQAQQAKELRALYFTQERDKTGLP